jgi:hypothetical protein
MDAFSWQIVKLGPFFPHADSTLDEFLMSDKAAAIGDLWLGKKKENDQPMQHVWPTPFIESDKMSL